MEICGTVQLGHFLSLEEHHSQLKLVKKLPAPIPGVLPNGQPNNINVVRDQSYWTSSLGGFGAVGEQFVQDGGWVRLREVSLSYDIPMDKVGLNFIKSGTFSFIGRNLWYTQIMTV